MKSNELLEGGVSFLVLWSFGGRDILRIRGRFSLTSDLLCVFLLHVGGCCAAFSVVVFWVSTATAH